MLLPTLALLILAAPPAEQLGAVSDTLDELAGMLDGDAHGIALKLEGELAALPAPTDCPDCNDATPCAPAQKERKDWLDAWSGLLDSKDFEGELREHLLLGLELARKRANHPWPELRTRLKRIRTEPDFAYQTIRGLARLELLEQLEGDAQAQAAREWLDSTSRGRAITVDGLIDFELRYLELLGEARPKRGPIENAIRDRRYGSRSAIDSTLRREMPLGRDVRAQEVLVVRWMTRNPTPENHDLLVQGLNSSGEERWAVVPLYFTACVQLGTGDSIAACVESLKRIEDARKELDREESRGKKLLSKRAPRDWELPKDDWMALRRAVEDDHARVVRRRRATLARYQDAAEELLLEFAKGHEAKPPSGGSERPHRSWSRWLKSIKKTLP